MAGLGSGMDSNFKLFDTPAMVWALVVGALVVLVLLGKGFSGLSVKVG